MVGNEKSQCLSSRGLPEESETHPDIIPSAIIEGVMSISNMGAFFLGHPVYWRDQVDVVTHKPNVNPLKGKSGMKKDEYL